eukprot:158952-Rhodomonas_salina.3
MRYAGGYASQARANRCKDRTPPRWCEGGWGEGRPCPSFRWRLATSAARSQVTCCYSLRYSLRYFLRYSLPRYRLCYCLRYCLLPMLLPTTTLPPAAAPLSPTPVLRYCLRLSHAISRLPPTPRPVLTRARICGPGWAALVPAINMGHIFYGQLYRTRSFIVRNDAAVPLDLSFSSNLGARPRHCKALLAAVRSCRTVGCYI